jgi:hypothetical protein
MSNSNLTSNYNFLSPTGFKLIINREKLSNLEFFCVSATLPDLSIGEVEGNVKQYKGYFTGDVTFGGLSLTVAVDEDLKVYQELFEWIINNRDSGKPTVYDATLVILTNHQNINKQIQFKNLFCTSVAALEFSTQSTDVEYLQAAVEFRYDEFKFV